MIKFAVETLDDCLEEMIPLLEDHYHEVAMYTDKIELNPDYDKYYQLEDMGMLHIVTAREEGILVGYFITFINRHIHYKDHVYALNDILYLRPDLRGTITSYDMFKYAEDKLKDMGVSVIVLHMKTSLPFEGLASKLGYDKAEYNYSKYVGN